MTTTNENSSLVIAATADLSAQASRYRAMTINGVLVPAATAVGASAQAIGILTSSSRSGELATAVYRGITKAIAGAAVSTLGYPVMCGSNGYIFAVLSGNNHIGRALETANSGDLFKVLVEFGNLTPWSGV